MPHIKYRTRSKQVINIFKELERCNTARFSSLSPSTAKSLRSLEKHLNNMGENVVHMFYDTQKKKGIVQCFGTPKVQNDTIYIRF